MVVTNCPLVGVVLGQDHWMVLDSSTFTTCWFPSLIWSSLWKNEPMLVMMLYLKSYSSPTHYLCSIDNSYCLHNCPSLPVWKIAFFHFFQSSSFRLNIIISFYEEKKVIFFNQKYFYFYTKRVSIASHCSCSEKKRNQNCLQESQESQA